MILYIQITGRKQRQTDARRWCTQRSRRFQSGALVDVNAYSNGMSRCPPRRQQSRPNKYHNRPQGMLLHDQASNPTVNQIPSNAKEVGELASVTLNTQVAGNKYTLQRLPVKPRDRLYPVLIPLKAFDSVSVGILMDLHERGRLPGTQVCLQDFVDAYRRRSQYRASVQ